MLICNFIAAQLQILSVFYESFSGTEYDYVSKVISGFR